MTNKKFTNEQAQKIGEKLGVTWQLFDIDQFCRGLNVELEHGTRTPATNVTEDDPIKLGKIALAHLNEFPDYYDRLEKMEAEADAYWANKKKSQ